ncbi:MAG: hypothetical protein ACLVG5_02640 [Clostridium sp.]
MERRIDLAEISDGKLRGRGYGKGGLQNCEGWLCLLSGHEGIPFCWII